MSERRSDIAAIAGQLFARRGFAATTVREIAEHAGILSGSLYHHFPSKEAIAAEILSQYYDGLADDFRAVVAAAASPVQALRDMLHIAYRGIAQYPAAVALIQNSGDMLFSLPSFETVASRAQEVQKVWLDVLGQMQDAGYFRSDIDARLAYTFIRDTLSAASRWWRPDGQLRIDQLAEKSLTILLYGIINDSMSAATRASLSSNEVTSEELRASKVGLDPVR